MIRKRRMGGVALAAAVFLTAGGCKEGSPATPGKESGRPAAMRKADDSATWWCAEHGMPEDECAQCKAELAAEFKKKGDWCKEHDRPESQCFICHPELKEKYAAQYRARYGKEPPALPEEKGGKEEKGNAPKK